MWPPGPCEVWLIPAEMVPEAALPGVAQVAGWGCDSGQLLWLSYMRADAIGWGLLQEAKTGAAMATGRGPGGCILTGPLLPDRLPGGHP